MKLSNLCSAMKSLPLCALFLLLFASLQPAHAQQGAGNEKCVAAPAGMIGWWRGEGDAVDAVSKEAASQDSVSYSAGKVGRAFDFTSTETLIRIPASDKRNEETHNGFTLELWVNPRDTESGQPLVEFRKDDKNVGAHLWIYDRKGRIWGNIRDIEAVDHTIWSSEGVLRPNVWQHVALVYDPAGVNAVASFYCNGALVARGDIGAFAPQMGYDLYLGGHRPNDPAERFLRGALDEVSLYNRPLSDDEIASIYLADAAGKCPPGQAAPKTGPAKPAEDLSLMAAPFFERPADISQGVRLGIGVEWLFQEKQYDKIEEVAARFRSRQSEWSNGDWKLTALYDQVSNPADTKSDAAFDARIAQLKDWIKQKPESVVAQIALAFAYGNGAIRARGTGYADTVTEQGGKLMEQRAELAHKALAVVSAQRKSYPEWYKAATTVARLGVMERKRYEELVDEGTRLFPRYHELPIAHAYYLLPRWYGEQGEWESYAARAADRVGGTEGDILYARIIWDFAKYPTFFKEVMAESKVSWSREKRGWAALFKRYPDNLRVATRYAMRASQNGDLVTARGLFQKVIKNRVADDIWRSEEEFNKFRTLVFAAPEKAKTPSTKH